MELANRDKLRYWREKALYKQQLAMQLIAGDNHNNDGTEETPSQDQQQEDRSQTIWDRSIASMAQTLDQESIDFLITTLK